MSKPVLGSLGVILLTIGFVAQTVMAQNTVTRMTKEELKAQLGNPDVVIIDVRLGRDWSYSNLKIKGAVRVEPRAVDSLTGEYGQDKTLIFYCA